jgi:CBS domain-containing protein
MPLVKDFMTKNVVIVDPQETVLSAARLMSNKGIGCLVVVDKIPIGIITERDLVRRVISKELEFDTKISEIMSTPLITVNPTSQLRDAARIMAKKNVRRLPVVKTNLLVGIIAVSDFARHLSKTTLAEDYLAAMARKIISEEMLESMEYYSP